MTPRPEDEVSQAEKRRIIRERPSTYIDHVTGELLVPGRFGALGQPTVTGQSSDPWPKLPDSSPWSGTRVDYVEPRDASQPSLDMTRGRRAEEQTKSALQGRKGPAAGGRFHVDEPYVVGSTPIPAYPPARQAADTGQEPPLGYDNPALDPNPEPGIGQS